MNQVNPIIPGTMRRNCTEIDTFVRNNGVDSYKNTYCPTENVEDLLNDPIIFNSNEEYEQTFGAGVTQEDICKYIEHWGVNQYREWCAREKTYDSIISNGAFASAQQKYIDSHPYDDSVEVGMRTTCKCNPFRQDYHDDKGVSVPEPCEPRLDDFFDESYSIYIQNNGIINYMLKVTSTYALEHLLNYREVAEWQRAYIRKLEYEDRLI
jgi:hypothetical protein